MASQSRPGGGRLGGTGRARDIREPEPGRSQAGTCHWMKVHRGRQQRGREAVPGSDRMCPARGTLLGRSEEAAEVGGLRKPECPHAWEPHFLAASRLEIPQVPPPWHGAHIPPCRPLPMRVSSAAPPQVKKTFSRSQNWSGNSGFLIPSPVASQPIFITCPGRRREVGTKANSPLSFPWETFRGSRLILTVSPPWPVPGTLTGAGPAFKDLWGFGLCAIYVFPGWSSRVLMPFKRAR